MKSDYGILRSKNRTVPNAEAISDNPSESYASLESPPFQLKINARKSKNSFPKINSSGAKLHYQLKDKMEDSFARDFSSVNIHENSLQATPLGAKAYTQDNDIHFAPGEYRPQSKSGQELLGHELTHVVQQRESITPETKKAYGIGVNDDHRLESEADEKGKKAASGNKIERI